MNLENLTAKAIRLSEVETLDSLYVELGRSLKKQRPSPQTTARPGVKYKARKRTVGAPLEEGKRFARLQIRALQKLVCNIKTGRPKKGVADSEWIALLAASVVDLVHTYGASAVLMAIIYKRGLVWFCKQ